MNASPTYTHSPYDGMVESLVYGVAFAIPLYIVGLHVGGFPLILPLVLLLVLDVVLLLRGRLQTGTTAVIAFFLVWCLLTAAGRHPPSSYVLSLILLAAILFPFCVSYPRVDPSKLIRWLLYGTYTTFFFAIYEVGMNVLGLPALEDYITVGTFEIARSGSYLGFQRVNGTYVEPAGYALYLVYVYALLDIAARQGVEIPNLRWKRAAILLVLLATLSFSGVVLLVGYLGASLVFDQRRRIARTLLARSFWKGVLAFLPVVAVVGYLYGETIYSVGALFVSRFNTVVMVLETGTLTGSEGGRIQSTLITFDYWQEEGGWKVLMGEGYTHHNSWLVNNFWYLPEGSSFRRGDVHSIFSVVGIATGVVGYVTYILLVYSIVRAFRIPLTFAALWILAHLSTGFLIDVQFWLPVLVAGTLFSSIAATQDRRS